ncbi:MAG: ABC transporter ATP-binding protein [Candidatus Hodarchaeales archaeon]|jgi:simple sugar transport system ATP-binding protein
MSESTIPDASDGFAVKMHHIVKKFPGVLANDDVNLQIRKGEIHALLGENGAGKTTLMNVLYGLYGPDSEESKIFIQGQEVKIKEPIDAMNNGIGMVHQHFMLVPIMSVTENIILGAEPTFQGMKLDFSFARKEVDRISRENGLDIDPDAIIENLPVGMQQRVEILKILYRGADILILDEPTAVLTPQEVTALFKSLNALKKEQGKTIIIITHKLKEPMALADRITVLRKGKLVGTVNRDDTSPEELAEMMIGRKLIKIEKQSSKTTKPLLEIQDLAVVDDRERLAVNGVNLTVSGGEIVGIAGVVGNGQSELAEAITGLREINSGRIVLNGKEINHYSTRDIYDAGLAYIPEDRQKTGTIGDFTVAENLILGLHHHKRWFMKGIFSKFYNGITIGSEADASVKNYDIRTPSIVTTIRSLSGGNQQKVVVARELSKNPYVVLASQVTRGLDVGVIEYVHQRLIELRDDGKAVLLISSDLEEILSLSDRIAVIYEGKIVAFEDPSQTNERRLGLLMAGHIDNENNAPGEI